MSTETKSFSEKIENAVESIMRHVDVHNETEAVELLAEKLKRSTRQVRRWLNEGMTPDNPHVVLKKLDVAMESIVKSKTSRPVTVLSESIDKKVERLERRITELESQLQGFRSLGKFFLENVTIGKAHV